MHATYLENIVRQAARLEGIPKASLRPGDWVLVRTRNSLYWICVQGEDVYSVSGGWFNRHGLSPATVTIAGCTWGGSAIKTDIVAACGLCLEFGNSVRTTRIQQVRVLRGEDEMRWN